jgi:hypothetical protein
MTAPWFEIDRTADRWPGPGIERYVLQDPWGDYCRPGEELRLTFTGDGPVERCRAIVTGHTEEGSAIVLPVHPPLAIVGGDIAGEQIPATVTPLPTRPSSPFPTGGEAS